MGQASCCSLRPSLDSASTRDSKVENEKFEKLKALKFSNFMKEETTFEEILKHELTNDLGEEVSPQTTQVLIAEFKKFMFLNQMNFRILDKSKTHYADIVAKPKKMTYYKGLVAPPALDVVWRILIHHEDLYYQFCESIFGAILERRDPAGVNESEKIFDYTRTLELKKEFSSFIFPFEPLWPELSNEDHKFEQDHVITITRKRLETMSNYIEKNLSKTVEQTIRNWKSFTQRAIDSIKISTSAAPQTPQ